jgi:hypothetical protein
MQNVCVGGFDINDVLIQIEDKNPSIQDRDGFIQEIEELENWLSYGLELLEADLEKIMVAGGFCDEWREADKLIQNICNALNAVLYSYECSIDTRDRQLWELQERTRYKKEFGLLDEFFDKVILGIVPDPEEEGEEEEEEANLSDE